MQRPGCTRRVARKRRAPAAIEVAALLQMGSNDGFLGQPELEALATEAYANAQLCVDLPDPLWLLERLGVRYRIGHPWGCSGAMHMNGVVIYKPQAPRPQGTALLHELAHVLLSRAVPHAHDERDVWLLTAALAFPLEELARVRDRGLTVRTLLREQRHADRWLLRVRAAIAREIYRVAA